MRMLSMKIFNSNGAASIPPLLIPSHRDVQSWCELSWPSTRSTSSHTARDTTLLRYTSSICSSPGSSPQFNSFFISYKYNSQYVPLCLCHVTDTNISQILLQCTINPTLTLPGSPPHLFHWCVGGRLSEGWPFPPDIRPCQIGLSLSNFLLFQEVYKLLQLSYYCLQKKHTPIPVSLHVSLNTASPCCLN